MNLEQARFNMIEQQIRTWEVLDPVILELLHQVPRENFVPDGYKGLAFADLEIPLGYGQVMLPPKLQARMVQILGIKNTDSVLEIGTGSGYMTALLAKLALQVDSVEIVPELSNFAMQKLVSHNVANATLAIGDGASKWGDKTYDAIVLTGSVPLFPTDYQHQLKPGGRLLAVVGEGPAMEAVLVTRMGPDAFHRISLFETCVPALQNAPQPERFSF